MADSIVRRECWQSRSFYNTQRNREFDCRSFKRLEGIFEGENRSREGLASQRRWLFSKVKHEKTAKKKTLLLVLLTLTRFPPGSERKAALLQRRQRLSKKVQNALQQRRRTSALLSCCCELSEFAHFRRNGFWLIFVELDIFLATSRSALYFNQRRND